MNTNYEVVIWEQQFCDLCKQAGKQTPAIVDGKTVSGPWAYMCRQHFEYYGRGLGLGRGQKLILAEEKDKSRKMMKQAGTFLKLADHFGDERNYEAAINALTKAIELEPNNARAFDKRGVAHGYRYEYDEAIADFNRAIEIYGTKLEKFLFEGIDEEDEVADSDNFTNNHAGAYNNRGLSYYKKYMFSQAIEDYNTAIALDPNIDVFYYNRGLAHYYRDEYAMAIADYNKAIKLDPTMADAYSSRGEAYASIKKYKKALADFDKALVLEPNNIDTYASRILVINLL